MLNAAPSGQANLIKLRDEISGGVTKKTKVILRVKLAKYDVKNIRHICVHQEKKKNVIFEIQSYRSWCMPYFFNQELYC